jgi:acyl transferase domain-containing protein
VCFVLSGQGSQYVGMGRELYESCQVFRQALDECDETWREVTKTLLPRDAGVDQGADDAPTPVAPSLVRLLYPSSEEKEGGDDHAAVLNRTANSQPALLAWEYALARLWQSWGVEPASMTGHSLGEIVAAVIAGMLTLREGLALVASRGWWMQRRPGTGAMAAVFATRERTEALISQVTQRGSGVLVLAAVNGPASVVISGERERVASLLELAETEGIKGRPLDNVHSAFHSPLLTDAVDNWTSHVDAVTLFASAVDRHTPASPEVISTTTTAVLSAEAARSMQHWRRHALEAVLLWPAVASMVQPAVIGAVAQPVVVLEIGPSSILTSQIRRGLPTLSATTTAMASVKTVPSLVKDRDSRASMFDALAQLYASGVDVSWPAVYADLKRASPDLRMIAAPTYAFLPTRCWAGPFSPSSAAYQQRASAASATTSGVWRWSPPDRPHVSYVDWTWDSANETELVPLRQHGFDGKAVLPAAAMLGLVSSALDAISSRAGDSGPASTNGASLGVRRLAILSRVEIPPPTHTGATTLRLQLALESNKDKGAAAAFDLYLVRPDDDGPPVKCATGQLLDHSARESPQLADAQALCQRSIDIGRLYDDLHAGGLSYGPLFRCVRALWAASSDASDAGEDTLPSALLSRIQVPDGSAPLTAPATILPAWVLDACLHTAGGFFIDDGATTRPRRTFLPVEFEGFRQHRPFTAKPGRSLWCFHQRVSPADDSDSDGSLNTVEVRSCPHLCALVCVY